MGGKDHKIKKFERETDQKYKKHKKKSTTIESKKNRHQSSSSSSNSEDERDESLPVEVKYAKEKPKSRLETEKERIRFQKEQQKEMIKALETPEEKRARRLAKKEAKEIKRRQKMGWDQDYMGYTNADNPFGDGKLLDTFVWHKKLEKQGLQHLAASQKKAMIKHKQETNKIELAKVKQQRLERERERQQRDEEMEMMQRDKEAEHFKVWEEQEDKFHLEQAKLRSRIRIKDGRAKPIDLLAKYASSAEEGAEDLSGLEMHEPYTYLNGLTMTDLDDLIEDIKVYMELEQGKNANFWRDMTVIVKDELQTLKKIAENDAARDTRREGVNKAVTEDVNGLFRSKTYSQLTALKQSIMSKIQTGGSSLDVGYWESLLSQLKAFLARARLRDRHQELLRSKLLKLKQEQLGDAEPDQPKPVHLPVVRDGEMAGPSGGEASSKLVETSQNDKAPAVSESNAELSTEDIEKNCVDDYNEGSYSPRLIRAMSDLPPDVVIIDAEEDALTTDGKRRLLSKTGDAGAGHEDAFIRRAKEGMDTQEEATFSVEAHIANQVFLWADKYRPRKPRFFNRVHTGFEWNKYNQTHYDFDNPPPKIVQGYKFNIFYPDLIDRTKPPTYQMLPDDTNPDFAILRFSTGPPYQDIAFKIVNREWEYSHKHGFRCQFLNSIFQLWFHFKRYRYRR